MYSVIGRRYMCGNILNSYFKEMYPETEKKKRDISTQRRPDSHTHEDHDLNFQCLPLGKHGCTQGEMASWLASYWVCVPLRAKTCPPSKPFMFLSTNGSLRGGKGLLVMAKMYSAPHSNFDWAWQGILNWLQHMDRLGSFHLERFRELFKCCLPL